MNGSSTTFISSLNFRVSCGRPILKDASTHCLQSVCMYHRTIQLLNYKMFFVLFMFSFFTFSKSDLQEIALKVYDPPSQDVLVKKYFQPENNETAKGDGKGFAGNLYEEADFSGNISRENTFRNVSNATANNNTAKAVSDVVWTGFLMNLLRNSYETTTYRYPTAVWTAEQHEKLKELRKKAIKKMPKVFLMRQNSEEEKITRPTSKPKRGRVKWKSSGLSRRGHRKDVDKFLEESLFRYLVSSNLIENIGNVSVETFSEILRNVTRQRADKRQIWPYDANKELRIKFRDEVFMRRKPESTSRGKFLEKQFQKRLEKMKDYFSRKNNVWRSGNYVEESTWKTEPLESSTETTTVAVEPSFYTFYQNVTEAASVEPVTNFTEAPTEVIRNEILTEANTLKPDFEELKLSVAETVYYKKRPLTMRTYRGEEEDAGVIPGIPEVDYPMYSSPPSTGFKCPKDIGQHQRMMADRKTRCQVFYICTGDGPAAAMLCPNGTMFNENVKVCDWWYNVDC